MQSPIAVSFEGPQAEQLRERLISLSGEDALQLTAQPAAQDSADERGGDLPIWFLIATAAIASASHATNLGRFFLDLVKSSKERSAAEQSESIELAKQFIDEMSKHEIDATLVLKNQQNGQVIRIASTTKASELDAFRSDALSEPKDG